MPNYIKAIRIGWLLSFTRMSRTEHHTLDYIHDHLKYERVPLCGISPAVHGQNLEIVAGLREIVLDAGPDAIGMHLLGSRAQGTSIETSDIDMTVIRFETSDSFPKIVREARRVFRRQSVDATAAAAWHGMAGTVPVSADSFRDLISQYPSSCTAWLDRGIYETPSLRLVRLAALEVLSTLPDTDAVWQSIRRQHAAAFLGQLGRMREKLGQRLDDAPPQVLLPAKVMKARRQRFSLPRDIQAYRQKGRTWLDEHHSYLRTLPGYKLQAQLRAPNSRQRRPKG